MLDVAITHFPRVVSHRREGTLQNAKNRAWQRPCSLNGMSHQPQRVVYVLKSLETPPRYYTGLTANLSERLDAHNRGHCTHTARHRPWVVDVVVKCLLGKAHPAETKNRGRLIDETPSLKRRACAFGARTSELMNITVSTRIDLLRLFLATALVMMCVSTIGAIVGLASWPAMQIIQDRANSLVSAAAALMNALSIGLVIWGLRMARWRASAQPESVWSRNTGVLDVARFVALVYLAGVVVSFIGQEARSFVELPIGNAMQIDMLSPTARFCFEVLFPAVGAVLLLVLGPRLLRNAPGSV